MRDRQFIVVSHIWATGPAFQLADYLRERAGEVIFIGHPFPYAPDTRSFLRIWRDGVLVHERKWWPMRGPDWLFYIKDVLLTLWWAGPRARRAVFIGVNNFNAGCGYIMQRLGRVETLVFYTIDYIPRRFSSRWLNRFYHWLDRVAVARSDRVWNLSPVMVTEREKRGVSPLWRSKQITVPVGTVVSKTGGEVAETNPSRVVFMGHLRAGQGVENLLLAMPQVIQAHPAAHLLIIGEGSLGTSLRAMALTLGLQEHVQFTGFVEELKDVLRMLRGASVAVAPYVDDESTYTRFTDPGKPKDYLASGLPVVITKVPHVATEIGVRHCGLVVDDTPAALAGAIIRLLRDQKMRQEFRANALAMAADYTWDQIFDKALASTL